MSKKFTTVGIGASAGGLEAINELFDNIDPDTGMAFIIIQHLSPDFKSVMDELLVKHTKMSIQVIHDRTPVKPNNVYLISNESNIVIKKGVLIPVERKDRHQLNLPIDMFFHSLGQDQQEWSVAVILSGTGTDGSRGIQTVKEMGGVVLVQDPGSAQFDGMPRAAIDTGIVDKVLPPFAIAQVLMNRVQSRDSGYLLFLNPENAEVQKAFNKILGTVEQLMNVDFTEYRHTTLYRRIEKRMFLSRHRSIEDYKDYLDNNPTEIKNLYKEFLIGVTRFFRDKEAFDLLNTEVISALVKRKPLSAALRIWVPACSSGEEVYSLAILLEENMAESKIKRPYKIFATDLDGTAIKIASRGIYDEHILEQIPKEYWDTYFDRTAQKELTIVKTIREKIVFTVHDALNDPPFINLDLISCRNFLIYLKPEIQQRLLVNFQFSLNYHGFLFLGPSESLGQIKTAFRVINERWNIFQNVLKNKLKPLSVSNQRIPAKKERVPKLARISHYYERNLGSKEELYSNWLLHHYVPTLLFVDKSLNILYINGEADKFLNFPRGPGAFKLEKMVEEEELLIFKTGVRKTIETCKVNVFKDINFTRKNKNYKLELRFEPASVPQLGEAEVLIEIKILKEEQSDEQEIVELSSASDYQQERLRTLEMELSRSKEEKQILVERLETTNEELQSSNEELLAANEELQSTNEELQSVNEELFTVNSELQNKVSELTLINSDLDHLLKSTGIGTVFVDDELNIRRFTPALLKQIKLTKGDIGRSITTFVNTFPKEEIYRDFKEVLKTGNKIEREIIDDDGNPYLMRLFPYQLQKKETNGVVGTFVNIGDIKAASEKIENLAQKFRMIFENSEDHISIFDENKRLLDVNKVSGGFKKEDILGKYIFDNLPEHAHPYFEEAFEMIEKTKSHYSFSTPIIMPNGEKHWYKNLLLYLDRPANNERYMFCSRNTTHLIDVESKVRKGDAFFEAFFNHASEHVLVMTPNGIVMDINFTDAGFQKHEIIGKTIVDITPGESKKLAADALEAIQTGKSAFAEYQNEFEGSDGKYYWYYNLMFSVRLEGNLDSIILISRSLNKWKEAEQQLLTLQNDLEAQIETRSKELIRKNQELKEANFYLDSFVHGAAHDLRSPLMQLEGFMTLLPEIQDPVEQKEIYTELKEATNRMERILNGLIELIEFKKTVTPVAKTLNVKKVYQEVLKGLNPFIKKHKAHIEADIPEQLNVRYIEAFLISIFYNLLHNAVKYRSYNRAPDIKVSVWEEDPNVVIQIKDNGIGMDLNRYGHFLFQPFKRLTVDRPGTGIGLSIINNSVRRNGGKIEVKSRLDRGSTFTVYLKSYVN